MNLKLLIKSFFLVGALSLPLISCQKDTTSKALLSKIASRGKGIYLSNCIVCHNPNPTLDGSIGPALIGSSLELLEAKLVHHTYPPGYKPKRTSGSMPEFSQLKSDIPAIHAYLESFK